MSSSSTLITNFVGRKLYKWATDDTLTPIKTKLFKKKVISKKKLPQNLVVGGKDGALDLSCKCFALKSMLSQLHYIYQTNPSADVI